MTRSQDFDAMSAHYGYAPVCAVLSQRFGATFEFTTTGGNCTSTSNSGGVAEGVVTALVDEGFTGPLARVACEDSFIPLGDAALEVLLSEDTIEAAAITLTQVSR
jgi:hypothetical protein